VTSRYFCGQSEYAQRRLPIPEWAAKSLNDLIYSTVRGDLASWDEAFGKIFVDHQQRRAQSLALMLRVWARRAEPTVIVECPSLSCHAQGGEAPCESPSR